MKIQDLYDLFLKHPHVTTDSRQAVPDGLFFALKGSNFDGNKFASNALEQGCTFAIIDDPQEQQSDKYILVDNVLETLQQLAIYHRQQLTIPVIGITGSNGKTTTKELCHLVLDSHYNTFATPGNFNNHIGVPLSLLAIPGQTEIAIIEMGANAQKEIDFLSNIAHPTHGLITNIGKAHLEGFGGIEGVKKGKSELYRYLAAKGGTVFINKNEPFLEELAAPCSQKIFYGSWQPQSETDTAYSYKLIDTSPFVNLEYREESGQTITINSQLYGAYNYNNIITAITLGRYFGVPGTKIKAAIEAYNPNNNRSQLLKKDSNTYILDAYNANPTSMKEAIKSFAQMDVEKKGVILGHMLELGEESPQEHQQLVAELVKHSFEPVILVGHLFKELTLPERFIHFSHIEDLKDWLQGKAYKNMHFLVKGSRKVGLEKIVS